MYSDEGGCRQGPPGEPHVPVRDASMDRDRDSCITTALAPRREDTLKRLHIPLSAVQCRFRADVPSCDPGLLRCRCRRNRSCAGDAVSDTTPLPAYGVLLLSTLSSQMQAWFAGGHIECADAGLLQTPGAVQALRPCMPSTHHLSSKQLACSDARNSTALATSSGYASGSLALAWAKALCAELFCKPAITCSPA